MDRHRLRADGPLGALPPRVRKPETAGGFILLPIPVQCPVQAGLLQELYRRARAEAEAVVQPSLPERDLAAWRN